MNPFLEPTVATPQAVADWGRPSPCPGPQHKPAPPARRPAVSGRRRRFVVADDAEGKRPGRLARMLRAAALAATFLLPGLAVAVDINSATPQQLQEIKGIGPKTADIIIQERERGGRFESFDDISERVKGIGPKKAASLQAAGLTVGGAASADAGKPAGESSVRSAVAAARRGR